MIWPPDALWPKLAAMWNHAHGSPGSSENERAKALAELKRHQEDFDLTDCQLAYIAEYTNLAAGSRIVRRERPVNAFEFVLGVIDSVGLVMPFEYAVVGAAWTIHTYVSEQFLHTPRLLVHSRQPRCGKTVLLNCIAGMARSSEFMIAPSPAVLYRLLETRPQTTFAIDNVEHSTLWDRQSVLAQFIEGGHRQGGFIPRVIEGEVVRFPTYAPLVLGLVIARRYRDKFPSQVVERAISLEMRRSFEGRDDIFPNDPRFAPVRVVISKFAETFRCSNPEMVILPAGVPPWRVCNWRALAAVADALGYGATLRAAAVSIEAASLDPKTGLYEEIFRIYEQGRINGLWTKEVRRALNEVEGGPWGSLTNSGLYDLLYPDRIGPKTIWKTDASGKRRSNNGLSSKQFESVWRELGLGHTETQSSRIIRLPRHGAGTGGIHDE